jgi:hypothetical protein
MRIIHRCLFLFLLSLAVPTAFAFDCGTSQWCGTLNKLSVVALLPPADDFAMGTAVDYCTMPTGGCTIAFATSCCNSYTYGSAGQSGTCYTGTQSPTTYYVSVRRTADDWGQDGIPIWQETKYGTCQSSVLLDVPPAPHKPNVTYPSTQGYSVPTASFNLRFQSGIDAVRNNPNWPVKYTVRLKTWPAGTTEPVTWPPPIYTGPCIAYGNDTGECKVAVTDLPSGNYRAWVVAEMDVSASIRQWWLLPVVYSNDATRLFIVPTGRPPGCCR